MEQQLGLFDKDFDKPIKVDLYSREFNDLFENGDIFWNTKRRFHVKAIVATNYITFESLGIKLTVKPGDRLVDDNMERHGISKEEFEKEFKPIT